MRPSGADPGGVPRVPWNPPFERASLTRDTLIEQSNRYTLTKLNRAVTLSSLLRSSVASYVSRYK